MIRALQSGDLEPLTNIIQAGYKASAIRIGKFFETGKTFVYDSGTIRGFCTLEETRQDHAHSVAGVRIYTDPACRRNGVASALWEAMLPDIRRLPVELVDTVYRTDDGNPGDFFVHRGFERWFTNVGFRYDGPRFAEPAIAWRQYDDRYFADYLSLINAAFEPMRRDNDIEPYVIFARPSFVDAELRGEFRDNAENFYVFLDGDRVIGVTEIGVDPDGNGFIDAVGVAPECQGRGLGRRITEFAVNRLYDRGIKTIKIGTQDRNRVARHLYERIGFLHDQDLEEARLWLRKPQGCPSAP